MKFCPNPTNSTWLSPNKIIIRKNKDRSFEKGSSSSWGRSRVICFSGVSPNTWLRSGLKLWIIQLPMEIKSLPTFSKKRIHLPQKRTITKRPTYLDSWSGAVTLTTKNPSIRWLALEKKELLNSIFHYSTFNHYFNFQSLFGLFIIFSLKPTKIYKQYKVPNSKVVNNQNSRNKHSKKDQKNRRNCNTFEGVVFWVFNFIQSRILI